MTQDRDSPADSAERPSERHLADCLRRLLNVTELNMDDMEQDTREAIREALHVLNSSPDNGQ